MKLTFHQGKFHLVSPGSLRPISPREAVKWKDRADEKAKKVFKRILVERFEAFQLGSLPDFLDHHQKMGIGFILSRSRAYLAHAPGAGKTAEAIIASLMVHRGDFAPTTLFIVPPNLTINWAREITKWTEWLNVWPTISVVPTSAYKEVTDWKADFIICPDSMLAKPWVYENLAQLRPKLLAVDEASRFKTATATRTQALFGGSGKVTYHGLIQNAKHAVLLDGSPMPNRPMELWAPLSAMAPEKIDFMNEHEFGVRYCGAWFDDERYTWDYSGASNLNELKTKLKGFMHVVPESALKHPERLRSLLFMTGKVAPEIKSWEEKHLQGKDFNVKDLDETRSQGEIALHRKALGLTKAKWVADYVRGRLENKSESILIFAWHREVCRVLAHELRSYRPGVVMGGTANDEREDIFRAFQRGRTRVVIGNIAAMGRGHNLQKAARVVFAEYSWTDELNKQCEKRASRKGSEHDLIRCDYVVVPGTLDETVLEAVFTKARNVKKVIG